MDLESPVVASASRHSGPVASSMATTTDGSSLHTHSVAAVDTGDAPLHATCSREHDAAEFLKLLAAPSPPPAFGARPYPAGTTPVVAVPVFANQGARLERWCHPQPSPSTYYWGSASASETVTVTAPALGPGHAPWLPPPQWPYPVAWALSPYAVPVVWPGQQGNGAGEGADY